MVVKGRSSSVPNSADFRLVVVGRGQP